MLDFYLNIMFIGIFLAFGIVLGLGVSIIVLHVREENIDKNKNSITNYEQEEQTKKTLMSRLQKRKHSWTEFICNEDKIDQANYIKQAQKKEDEAYKFVKNNKSE